MRHVTTTKKARKAFSGPGLIRPENLVILLFLAVLVLPLLGRAAGVVPQPPLEYVRVGYTASLFGEVDLQDAKLATKTWSDELGKLMNLKPLTLFFANLAELTTLIKNQEVDLVVVDSLDYLRLKGQGDLEPVLTGIENGQVNLCWWSTAAPASASFPSSRAKP